MGHDRGRRARRRTRHPAGLRGCCARIGADRRGRPLRRLPLRRRPVRAGDEPSAGSRRRAGLRRRRQRRDVERALVRGAVHASAGGRRHRRRAVRSAAFEPGPSSITGWPAAVRTSVRAVRGRSSPGSWDSPTTGPTATTRSGSRSAAAGASSSRSRGTWACGSMAGCSRRSWTSTPAAACAGGCIVGLNVNVVWQAEFTAGLVLVF